MALNESLVAAGDSGKAIAPPETQKASNAGSGSTFQELSATEASLYPATGFGGVPFYYGWKDVIAPGTYQVPLRRFRGDTGTSPLVATPERIKHWDKMGNQMIQDGINIPIVLDHSEAADDNRGYAQKFRVNPADGRLEALCQLRGNDARDAAARNDVSILRVDDYNDGQGKQWHDVIRHIALTPIGIVGDQGEFHQAASAAGSHQMADKMLKCTDAQYSKLHDMIQGLSAVPDDEKMGHVVGALCNMSMADDGDAGENITKMSRAEIGAAAKANRAKWKADSAKLATDLPAVQQQLSSATTRVSELSAQIPNTMAPSAVKALRDSASAYMDIAVSKGAITPAVRDRVYHALAGTNDKPNYQCLSSANGTDEAPILTVAKVLAENTPAAAQQLSGAQTLTRTEPDGVTPKPLPYLRKRSEEASAFAM